MKVTKTGEQITIQLGPQQASDVHVAALTMAGRAEQAGIGYQKETLISVAGKFDSSGGSVKGSLKPITTTLSRGDAMVFSEAIVAIAVNAASGTYSRTLLNLATMLEKALVPQGKKQNPNISPEA